jgi:SAM-dependent methyltransferase
MPAEKPLEASFSHILTNRKVFELVTSEDLRDRTILDVGAGEGYFCKLLGDHIRGKYHLEPRSVLRCCDLFPEHFRYDGIVCDRIDANRPLPYEDGSIDTIVCIEVIEHIEDPFRLIREMHRILKPGGRLIVTTPNVLNANSRFGYVVSGFGSLFGPLPLGFQDPVNLEGHIHPVSFYYLAYMFYLAGFGKIEVHFDRTKKSAIVYSILLAPFILLGFPIYERYVRRKNRALHEENRHLLARINTFGMLTSRTLIVEGFR